MGSDTQSKPAGYDAQLTVQGFVNSALFASLLDISPAAAQEAVSRLRAAQKACAGQYEAVLLSQIAQEWEKELRARGSGP